MKAMQVTTQQDRCSGIRHRVDTFERVGPNDTTETVTRHILKAGKIQVYGVGTLKNARRLWDQRIHSLQSA